MKISTELLMRLTNKYRYKDATIEVKSKALVSLCEEVLWSRGIDPYDADTYDSHVQQEPDDNTPELVKFLLGLGRYKR